MDTFQALVLDKKGEQPYLDIRQLRNNDLPDGDLTIRVAYSSVNFKEGMVAINHQLVESYPLIPGIDLAGTVIDSQNDRLKEGGRGHCDKLPIRHRPFRGIQRSGARACRVGSSTAKRLVFKKGDDSWNSRLYGRIILTNAGR